MNGRHAQPYLSSSLAIRQEIQRFESVHPSIYAIYDIIEMIHDPAIAQQIREHVVCIEDSFVNSQEWTLSRAVPDLRLGIVGSLSSGKSALVHRYLTGSYMQEESPEGGRFKKEILLDGQSHLLLIRDEGGTPELQFTAWVDAVIFVFSLENESSFNTIYNYYAKMAHFRNTSEIPLILVGTQDAISENNPRVIDDGRARKLASDLKRCSYYETCATYGLNVEKVFHEACSKIINQRMQQGFTPNNSRPSTPTHLIRYPSMNNGLGAPFPTHPVDCGMRYCGAELTGITRNDSFRAPDENYKRASAPQFMAPPPPPEPELRELPTPSSTPTTSRKSRRKSNLFNTSKTKEDKYKKDNGEVGSGRAIPIKQGYLYKKSSKSLNKEWKKKYVTLGDDGILKYHASLHDYMGEIHGKEISLQYTTVKVPGMKPRGSRIADTSEVNLPGIPIGRPSIGGVPNSKDKVTLTSYEALDEPHSINGIESTPSKIETPNVKKRHRRIKSSGLKNDYEDTEGYEFCIVSLDNKSWFFDASSSDEREEWVSAIEQQILSSLQLNESNKNRYQNPQAIQALRQKVPGNQTCADCGAPNPEWASINLGIVLCIECSGIHRNLGSHISKVRSLDLDEWPPGPLSVMSNLGNELSNNIWEARPGHGKPGPKSDREEKEKWIRRKYESKEFLQPVNSTSLHKQMVDCVCRGDVRALASLLPQAKEYVNSPLDQRDQRTLIHLAASFPSLPCTQLLLWNTCDVKLPDSEGRTPLYYAKLSGNKDVIDLLIQNGCPDHNHYVPQPLIQIQPFTPTPFQPSTLPRRKGSIGINTDKLV